MGIGRFFKSLVNPEVMGEEVVAMLEKMYRHAVGQYPGADPHMFLAQAWVARMAAHGKNPWNETRQVVAFSETMQFACVPPPNNARALGLYFLYKERPDILQAYPKFGMEFESLMTPVFKAMENGSIDELYQRYNPQMANEQVKNDNVVEVEKKAPALQASPAGGNTNTVTCPRDDTKVESRTGNCPTCGSSVTMGSDRCPNCNQFLVW